jgi:hypothetical protein
VKPRFYAFAKVIMHIVFALVYRLRTVGADNLPGSGAAILCGNHLSLLDPLAAAVSVGRPVRFMGKKELFKAPALRWLIQPEGDRFAPPDPETPLWESFLRNPEAYEFLYDPDAAHAHFVPEDLRL